MPLRNPYTDAFLAQRVTQAREDQAFADVTELGTLPEAWVSRLTVLRTYVITCMEMTSAPDDTFAAKLAAYRKDYTEGIALAKAAQKAAEADAGTSTASAGSFFTIPLERS